jgi:hypothetical protein
VLLHEGERRLDGLVVPLDRRRLASADVSLVRISTCTTSAQSADSREMTNVSASCRRTMAASTSTRRDYFCEVISST